MDVCGLLVIEDLLFDTGRLLHLCVVNFGLVDLGVVFGIVVVVGTTVFELIEVLIREIFKALFRITVS